MAKELKDVTNNSKVVSSADDETNSFLHEFLETRKNMKELSKKLDELISKELLLTFEMVRGNHANVSTRK